MRMLKKSIFVLGAAALLLSSCKKDDENKTNVVGDKDGVVLVTFGSSFPAPQKTFSNIEVTAKTKFTGEEIRWGYTSDIILNKLRKGEGEGTLNGTIIDNDTPEEALTKMVAEGYSKITIQSLHVIPGEEFDELTEAVHKFELANPGITTKIGRPLLDSDDDIKNVAKILAEKFKTEVANGPVLFMGHGTPHKADAQYGKMEVELKKINANFFVGTVEGIGFDEGKGSYSIGSIVTKLNAISPKPTSVTITPLMSIAGDHANNDMNGVTGETDPAEQSWKERLEGNGYTVNSIMKGLGDYDEINAIWMSHLEVVKFK